jgi:hypothetical protein
MTDFKNLPMRVKKGATQRVADSGNQPVAKKRIKHQTEK